MLDFIGDFAKVVNYISFLASFFCVVFYFKSINESKFIISARTLIKAVFGGIIIMSFILMILILNHQYQYIYVFNNSSNELPFGLLISTFFAGQEGSFLFWLLCLSVIGVFLLSSSKRNDIEAPIMAIYGIIITFLLLLLMNKTPFDKIWNVFPEAIRNDEIPSGINFIRLNVNQWVMIPQDGAGLNPLLQNFWMQIHPPILFIGFSLMAVPFVFALSALIIREYVNWVKQSMPWLIVASFFLGLGLILGAFWAYETLGWGGYWGWDPVENSSLIPWIVSIALIHTMITQLKNGGLVKTNLFFAVMSFVLVIYSAFLTRSGILKDSSVHSFTEAGSVVYLLLFVFVSSLFFMGIGLMLYRNRDFSVIKNEYKILSKEGLLSLGSIILSLSAIIILAGTSYPIFFKSAVETSFYDKWNIPLVILINTINALSIVAGWGSDTYKNIIKRIVLPFIISIVITILAIFMGAHHYSMIVLIWSSFFSIFVNTEKLLHSFRFGIFGLGGVISHIGVAILIIGIVCSGKYSITQHMELPLGETKTLFGYEFKYLGEELFDNGKKSYFNISMREANSHAHEKVLKPIMFLTQMANGIMRIPDIEETISKDIYLSPVSIENIQNSGKERTVELIKGEMIKIDNYFLLFDSYQIDMDKMMSGGYFSINANIKLLNENKTESMMLTTVFDREGPKYSSSSSKDGRLNMELEKVIKGDKPVAIVRIKEANNDKNKKETLIAEISIKQGINLFWVGNVLMLIGILLAYYKRKNDIIKLK